MEVRNIFLALFDVEKLAMALRYSEVTWANAVQLCDGVF